MYPVSSKVEQWLDKPETEDRYLYWVPIYCVRLSVRTTGFQPVKRGSIPLRSTIRMAIMC